MGSLLAPVPRVHGSDSCIQLLPLLPRGVVSRCLSGIAHPRQFSGLENSMDCIAHGAAKSRTRLSGFPFHFITFMMFILQRGD